MKLKTILKEILELDQTKFKLPKLEYGINELKPIKSVDLHYNKHHGGYVKKLNDAIGDGKYKGMRLEDIIIRSHLDQNLAVYNNAAQHFNHSFFWNLLNPKPEAKEPSGPLMKSIETNFGSYDNFKKEIIEKGSKHFGSGWVWVIRNGNELRVQDMHDADSPVANREYPIMVIDLWEHAYYMDYQNDREKYLKSMFDIIDWSKVEANFNGYKR